MNLREANRALRTLPESARQRVQPEMNVTAFQVARGAAARVRRRTGFLQSQVGWVARPKFTMALVGIEKTSKFAKTKRPEAFYWKFLEYGTVKLAARPFLRPAAEAMRADHEQRLLRALQRAGDDVSARARLV